MRDMEVSEHAIRSAHAIYMRAFTEDAMMVGADVIEGGALSDWIARMFENVFVAFIDVHNAKPGCFAARVRRA